MEERNEIVKKAYCNLYVAYFTLTEEIGHLFKYAGEIENETDIYEISYKTCIIINQFLSVNTILFNTFTKDLFYLYGEKEFLDTFESELFAFVLYLRNFMVHEGFYKIRVIPKVKIEIENEGKKYQLFKINLNTKDLLKFLDSEIARKPNKSYLIYKARLYIEKYKDNADITEVIIEYFNKIITLYRLFDKRSGLNIEYLKNMEYGI